MLCLSSSGGLGTGDRDTRAATEGQHPANCGRGKGLSICTATQLHHSFQGLRKLSIGLGQVDSVLHACASAYMHCHSPDEWLSQCDCTNASCSSCQVWALTYGVL